jgi:hypothetical protein
MKMKLRSNTFPARTNLQRAQVSTWSELDLLKGLALLMTILGTQAWIAGEAFNYGYWNAAHWPGSAIQVPLQNMAFTGFVGPFYNWLAGGIFLFCLGPYIALMAIQSKNLRVKPAQWAVPILDWWRRRFTFDEATGKLAAVVTMLAVALFGVIILMSLWIVGALQQGANLFKTQVCQLRAAEALPTTIQLGDGSKISGRVLDRSDKVIVIMDREAIHVLAVGEKSQLLDSTRVADVKCGSITTR